MTRAASCTQSHANATVAVSGVGTLSAVVTVGLREVALQAEAFFTATVAFTEPFVATFLMAADFLEAAAAFLAPTFLVAARTFGAAFDGLDS